MEWLWKYDSAWYTLIDNKAHDFKGPMVGTAFLCKDDTGRLAIGFYKNPSIIEKASVYSKGVGNLGIAIGTTVGYGTVKVGIATITGKATRPTSSQSGIAKFANEHFDDGVKQIKEAGVEFFEKSTNKHLIYADKVICKCYKEGNHLELEIIQSDLLCTHLIGFSDGFFEKKKNKVLFNSLGITPVVKGR